MNKSDKGCRQGKYTEYIGGTYFKQSQENVNQRADQKDAYVDINQLDENISSSECLLLISYNMSHCYCFFFSNTKSGSIQITFLPDEQSERHCLRRYWQVLTIIQSRRIL